MHFLKFANKKGLDIAAKPRLLGTFEADVKNNGIIYEFALKWEQAGMNILGFKAKKTHEIFALCRAQLSTFSFGGKTKPHTHSSSIVL